MTSLAHEPPPKIRVLYHVATIGDWNTVVQEQLELLARSGLQAAAAGIEGTVLGDGWHERLAQPGFTMERDPDLGRFEFPTLKRLWDRARTDPPFFALYWHAKGVSRPAGQQGPVNDWRRMMDYFAVERWRDAVAKLEQGHDTLGCNPGVFADWPGQPLHWSGNVWWARSEHLAQLPDPARLNQAHRFEAEAWVGMRLPPNPYVVYTSGLDHYTERLPRSEYEGKGYR